MGVRVIEFPPLPLHWVTWAVAAIGPAHTPRLNEYNGTSLIKHGDSENGRWLVVKFENVKHRSRRCVLKIKNVVEQLSVLKFALWDLKNAGQRPILLTLATSTYVHVPLTLHP